MVEPGYENEWTLDFFTFPPENQGWIHVNSSNYTRDDIYQHLVLTGMITVRLLLNKLVKMIIVTIAQNDQCVTFGLRISTT